MNCLKVLFDDSKRKLPVHFQISSGFIACLGITLIKCFHAKAAVVKMEILYKPILALTGNDEAHHGNSEKEPVRDHSSVA